MKMLDDLENLDKRNLLVDFLTKAASDKVEGVDDALIKGMFTQIPNINGKRPVDHNITTAMLNLIKEKSTDSYKLLSEIINDRLSSNQTIWAIYLTALFIKEERINRQDNSNIKEIINIFCKKAKEHFIDGKNNIYKELSVASAPVLHVWASGGYLLCDSKKEEVTDYLISTFKEDPENYHAFVVNNFSQVLITDQQPFFNDWVKGYEGFYNLDKLSKVNVTSVLEKHEDIKKFYTRLNKYIKDYGLLGQPLSHDMIKRYTESQYPKWNFKDPDGIIFQDLDKEKYKIINDIDIVIKQAIPFVDWCMQNGKSNLFQYGTDFIKNSLGYIDKSFRSKHPFSQETLSAFAEYEQAKNVS